MHVLYEIFKEKLFWRQVFANWSHRKPNITTKRKNEHHSQAMVVLSDSLRLSWRGYFRVEFPDSKDWDDSYILNGSVESVFFKYSTELLLATFVKRVSLQADLREESPSYNTIGMIDYEFEVEISV